MSGVQDWAVAPSPIDQNHEAVVAARAQTSVGDKNNGPSVETLNGEPSEFRGFEISENKTN
jgi:hypothetical protein